MGKLIAALIAVAAFAAFGAGTAGAATWQVDLGMHGEAAGGDAEGGVPEPVLPGHAPGERRRQGPFTSATFHTATYLGGTPQPALFLPDPAGASTTGINDAAGTPFYFNGLAKLIYNGAAFGPVGGKAIPGKGLVSTGVLSPGPNGKPVSATMTFGKAGAYKLRLPAPSRHGGERRRQGEGRRRAGRGHRKAAGGGGAGRGLGEGEAARGDEDAGEHRLRGRGAKTTLFAMLPKQLTVKAGTTVNFVNKSPSEPHNVAFGPKKYIEGLMKKVDLIPAGPGSPNQAPPFFPVRLGAAGRLHATTGRTTATASSRRR